MKGINRHSFHPDGGRTTNKELSIQDALLIKEMNMNAVRSHYPPMSIFWMLVYSLDLLYIDELAAGRMLRHCYRQQVGKRNDSKGCKSSMYRTLEQWK